MVLVRTGVIGAGPGLMSSKPGTGPVETGTGFNRSLGPGPLKKNKKIKGNFAFFPWSEEGFTWQPAACMRDAGCRLWCSDAVMHQITALLQSVASCNIWNFQREDFFQYKYTLLNLFIHQQFSSLLHQFSVQSKYCSSILNLSSVRSTLTLSFRLSLPSFFHTLLALCF